MNLKCPEIANVAEIILEVRKTGQADILARIIGMGTTSTTISERKNKDSTEKAEDESERQFALK